MDDKKIKETAAELLRNKETIFRLLSWLRPEDIERGTLVLPDQLINEELRDFIIDRTSPYLSNYQLSCTKTGGSPGNPSGLVFLDLDLQIRQLGKLRARYMISVSELTFTGESRRLAFHYREDVRSLGNPLQAMALKALLGDKTLLMRAAEMTKNSQKGFSPGPALSVGRDSALLDLNRLPLALPDFLDCVDLWHEETGDGFLRFRFAFRQIANR